MEKEEAQGEKEKNQNPGQDPIRAPPSPLQDGKFNENAVNKTKAPAHLAKAQDQSPLPCEPIHEGWAKDGPAAEGASQRHQDSKKEIKVPKLPTKTTTHGCQAQNNDPKEHNSSGPPAVGEGTGERCQETINKYVQGQHDGNVAAAPPEFMKNGGKED
jgi:hypothetical protein